MCHTDTNVDTLQPESVETSSTVDKQNMDCQDVPCDRIRVIPDVTSLPGIWPPNKSTLRILCGTNYLYIVRRRRRYHPYKRPRGYFRRPKSNRQTGTDKKRGSHTKHKTGNNKKPSNCITSDGKALGPLMNIQDSLMNFGLSYLTESDYRQMREWESESETSLTVTSSNTQGCNNTDYQNPFFGITITYAVVPTTFTKANKYNCDKPSQTRPETIPSETTPVDETNLTADALTVGEKNKEGKCDHGTTNEKKLESDNERKNREVDITVNKEGNFDKTNIINDKFPEQDTAGEEGYLKTDPDDDDELDLNDESVNLKNAEVCALLGFKYEGAHAFYEKLYATLIDKSENSPGSGKSMVNTDEGVSHAIGTAKDVAPNRSQLIEDVKKPNADLLKVAIKGLSQKTNHNTMTKDKAPSKIAKKPKSDLLDVLSLKPTSDTTTVTTCKPCKHRKNELTTKQDENPRTDLYDSKKEVLKRYPSEKDSVKSMVYTGKGHSTIIGDANDLAPSRNQIYKVGKKSKPNELEVAVKGESFKETNDAISVRTNISINERQGESMTKQDKTRGTNPIKAVFKQTNTEPYGNTPMVNKGKALPTVMSKSEKITSFENQIYKLGKKPESDHLEVSPKSEGQRIDCDPTPMSACTSDDQTQSQSVAKLDENPGTYHNSSKGKAVLKQNNTAPVLVPRRVVIYNQSNKSRFEESATKMKTDDKSAVNAVNTGVSASTKPSSRRQIICHEKSESVDDQKEKRGTASIPDKNFGTKNVVSDKIQLGKNTKSPKSDHLKIIPKENNDTISVKSNTPDKQRQREVPNKLVVCSDYNYCSRAALGQNYTAPVAHRILVSYTSKKSRFEEGADKKKTYCESGNSAKKTTGTEQPLSRKITCLNFAKISGFEDKTNCVKQGAKKGQNNEETPSTDINKNLKGVVLKLKETVQVTIPHQRLLLNPSSKSRFEESLAKTRTNSRSDDDAENTSTPPSTKPSSWRQSIGLNPNKKSGYVDKSECVKTDYQKTQSESMTKPVENLVINDVTPDRNQFDKFAAKPKSDNQQVKPNGAAQKTNHDIISVTTNKPDKQPPVESTSKPNGSPGIDHIDPTKVILKQNSTEPGPVPHRIQIVNQSKKSRFEEGREKKRTCDSDDAEKTSSEKPSSSRKVVCLNPTQMAGFGDKESTNKLDENRGSGHNNSTKIVLKRKNEPVPASSRVLDLNASKKSRFEEGAEKKTCDSDDAELKSCDKPSSSRQIICLNPTKRPMCADKETTSNRDEKPGTSHTNSTKIVLKPEYDEMTPEPRRVLNLNQSKQSRFEEGQEKMISVEDPENTSSNKTTSSRQIVCLNPAKRSRCVDKDYKKRQSDSTNKFDKNPGTGNNKSTKIVLKRKHMETAPVPHRILHLNPSKNSRFEEGAKKVKINDRSGDNAVQNSSIKSQIICLNPTKKSRCEENAGCENKDDRINLGNGNFIPPHKRNPAAESSKPSSSTEMVSSNFFKQPIQKIVWQDTKPNCKDNITISLDNRRTNASEAMKTSSRSRQIICLNPHKKVSNVTEKSDKESSESLDKYQRDVSVKSRLGLRGDVSVKSRLGYIGAETSQDSYSRQNYGTDTYSPSVHKKGRRGWRKTQADTNPFPDMTNRRGSKTNEHQRKGRIRRY